MTALVRSFVGYGIQGLWVEFAMPGDPARLRTLTVDYTVDGRRRTASADRPRDDPAGRRRTHAPGGRALSGCRRAADQGPSQRRVPDKDSLEVDDPGISPPVGREIGSQESAPPLSVEKSTTVRIEVADLPDPIDVRGPWEVHFPGGSAARKRFRSIGSFRGANTDPGVKYFSGTATYRKTLDVPADWILRDRVNWTFAASRSWRKPGSTARLGILWKPLFRVKVTRAPPGQTPGGRGGQPLAKPVHRRRPLAGRLQVAA